MFVEDEWSPFVYQNEHFHLVVKQLSSKLPVSFYGSSEGAVTFKRVGVSLYSVHNTRNGEEKRVTFVQLRKILDMFSDGNVKVALFKTRVSNPGTGEYFHYGEQPERILH